MRTLFTRDFSVAFLAYLLAGLAFCGYLHLPGHLADLGASQTTIGLLVALSSLFSTVLRPWVGGLADKHGRRPLIMGGSALALVVCLLYVGVDSVGPYLFTVRVLHGVSSAIIFSVFFTYAADIVPASARTQGLALFGVAGMSPLALGGLLGDAIVPAFGYRTLYLVLASLQLGSFVLTLFMRESRSVGDATTPHTRELLLRPELLPLWLLIFGFEVAAATYFTFLKTFVDDTGVGSVGLFFGFYAGAAILLRVFLGWVPDRLGPRRTLVPSLAASIAGYIVLSQTTTTGGLIVAGILTGTGHGFVYPIVAALVVTRARTTERGAALALYTAVYEAGLLLGSPVVGFILERFGYPVMYRAAAVLVVVALGVFASLDRKRRPAHASG
jgi:MFS family permease